MFIDPYPDDATAQHNKKTDSTEKTLVDFKSH